MSDKIGKLKSGDVVQTVYGQGTVSVPSDSMRCRSVQICVSGASSEAHRCFWCDEDGIEDGLEMPTVFAATMASLIVKARERDALLQWKESMLSVMPPMDEIGAELDVKLGESVHDKILPGIIALKEELADAAAKLSPTDACDFATALKRGLSRIDELEEALKKFETDEPRKLAEARGQAARADKLEEELVDAKEIITELIWPSDCTPEDRQKYTQKVAEFAGCTVPQFSDSCETEEDKP